MKWILLRSLGGSRRRLTAALGLVGLIIGVTFGLARVLGAGAPEGGDRSLGGPVTDNADADRAVVPAGHVVAARDFELVLVLDGMIAASSPIVLPVDPAAATWLALDGDEVTKGQVLATTRAVSLDDQRSAITEAIVDAERNLRRAREDQRSATTPVPPDPAALAEAEAAERLAIEAEREAAAEVSRLEAQLASQGDAADSQLLEDVAAARERLRSGTAALDAARLARTRAAAPVAPDPTTVRAAARVVEDAALALDRARSTLERFDQSEDSTDLIAPVDGRLAVGPDRVAVIPRDLFVEVPVDPEAAFRLSSAELRTITVSMRSTSLQVPDFTCSDVDLRLSAWGEEGDTPSTSMLSCRVPSGLGLVAGLEVLAVARAQTVRAALTIPLTAIGISGDRYQVALLNPDGSVEFVDVEIGASDGLVAVVLDGLSEGDTVARSFAAVVPVDQSRSDGTDTGG